MEMPPSVEVAPPAVRRWPPRFAQVHSGSSYAAPRARRSSRRRRRREEPPATIWPCSWPLPATTSMSPSVSRAAAAAMAARRSPTRARRARRRGWRARMAAGSSLRGLSSVTMARSARRWAIAPISGRLAAVAVAARAEDHDQPAARRAGAAPPARSPGRRACGRSRHRLRRPGGRSRRAAGGRARLEGAPAPPAPPRRLAGGDAQAGGHQGVDAWKAPTSGSRISKFRPRRRRSDADRPGSARAGPDAAPGRPRRPTTPNGRTGRGGGEGAEGVAVGVEHAVAARGSKVSNRRSLAAR